MIFKRTLTGVVAVLFVPFPFIAAGVLQRIRDAQNAVDGVRWSLVCLGINDDAGRIHLRTRTSRAGGMIRNMFCFFGSFIPDDPTE